MLPFRWKTFWPAGAFLLASFPLATAFSGADPAAKTVAAPPAAKSP